MARAPSSASSRHEPTLFATPAAFRRWLTTHHATATELWVGFHRTATGRPSITWPQSVDEALCFGWLDGVRRSLDAERYVIRFTPRKRGSTWSLVNTRRAEARFRAVAGAWSFWEAQPAGYHKIRAFWVVSAKREDTRVRRLETLIADSAAGRRIAPLRRPGT